MPFREHNPGYQREWRLARALREMRDAIAPVVRAFRNLLARLITRARAILADRTRGGLPPPPRQPDRAAAALARAERLARLLDEIVETIEAAGDDAVPCAGDDA